MRQRIGRLLRLWFGFEARVDRRAYALTGFSLMAFKYLTDAAIFYAAAGVVWTPLDYLSPLLRTRSSAIAGSAEIVEWLLVLWTLPFIWVGASMTVRRAIDHGLPAVSGLLFFVPVVNYVWMLALCVLPSAPPSESRAPAEIVAAPPFASIARAGSLGAMIGTVLVAFSTVVLESYGASLFIGSPFVIGFAAAWLHNRRQPHSVGESIAAGQVAVLITGGALLLFALEGVVCLVMAWPLAAALALVGALLGHAVAQQNALPPAHATSLLLALPLLMGAESVVQRPPLREVTSTIEIDAPPEQVWPHVVGFSELPPPSRLVFELGIAYPMRARIEGSGVGAVRYCEFSTGPFVEPITHWEPPHRLGFDVAQQPEPMTETSPYRRVHAQHLLDGFISERGEFRLIALPGGRTRLEGSTWYRIDLFPQLYWTPQSDALLHAIHERVLEHIASLSETATPSG